jgi:Uma2 family endonuclease
MSASGWVEDATQRLRRVEYEKMAALGIFEDQRVELLDGVVVRMSPHSPLHDATIDDVARLFMNLFAARARVRIQSAFAAGDGSEPEPDIAVVPPGDYRSAHPHEGWLIVEVADSSLQRDRTKARIYAESAVTEVWIVNVAESVIEVHLDPAPSGYATSKIYRKGERIRPQRFPDVDVAASDILK